MNFLGITWKIVVIKMILTKEAEEKLSLALILHNTTLFPHLTSSYL